MFEPHRRHCVVPFSKNIYPSLVLVQRRKTRPFITERLLMGRKESNRQTNLPCKPSVRFVVHVNRQIVATKIRRIKNVSTVCVHNVLL